MGKSLESVGTHIHRCRERPTDLLWPGRAEPGEQTLRDLLIIRTEAEALTKSMTNATGDRDMRFRDSLLWRRQRADIAWEAWTSHINSVAAHDEAWKSVHITNTRALHDSTLALYHDLKLRGPGWKEEATVNEGHSG
jgi:hypothetical protein